MKTHQQLLLLIACISVILHPSVGLCGSPEGEPQQPSPAGDTEKTVYMEDIGEITALSISTVPALPATPALGKMTKPMKPIPESIYEMPYSMTGKFYDWKRLWINTGVLCGAFVGSLVVLECLPEDATSWNRAEIQDVPLFRRWHDHVIVEGPEWDHDKFYFNYILHPYAGAAYFMAARSCGFNFWQSLLYCSLISNVGWEFGIEAFMERPSYQDLFITPLVGSVIGECFYRLKRKIVANGYRLGGSPVWGNIVAFLIDPVNEVIGLFGGNPARKAAKRMKRELTSSFVYPGTRPDMSFGFILAYTF